jgi:hypothetical protein
MAGGCLAGGWERKQTDGFIDGSFDSTGNSEEPVWCWGFFGH